MAQPNVLIVDDDTHLAQALAELLGGRGYRVTVAHSAEEALDKCRSDSFHLVLSDLQMPGRNGLSLIKTLNEACPSTATVLITGHGSIRSAVTALKRGAVEYMTKPVKPKRLLALCAALTADAPSFLPNALLADASAATVSVDGMQGRSRAMHEVFERARLAAINETPVLVVGESGTGKELVARSIHSRSARRERAFVVLQSGAVPQHLIAAELFGNEKDAAPGAGERKPGKLELAAGGTLFLDEIATLDERTQASLLRFLESASYCRVGGRKERPADVRIVAASSRDLESMVRAGQVRKDLYYRINTFAIRLAPLRERGEDIPVLADAILRELAARYGKRIGSIPAETHRILAGYSWPGNVRELRNVIEQAVLLARGPALDPLLLPQMLHREPPRAEVLKIAIGTAMGTIEKEVILRTLEANQGNKTATADALGISRRSIYNKLAAYGI